MTKTSWFLVLAAVGLTPIALAYGLMPGTTLPLLYGIEVESPSLAHVFRAVMGLYLAMVVLWLMGALNRRFETAALYSLIVFMLGLAAGRLISLLVDGVPSPLLIVYLLLEIGFGVVGLMLARRAE